VQIWLLFFTLFSYCLFDIETEQRDCRRVGEEKERRETEQREREREIKKKKEE
jgi:hypothetical protein